MTRNDDRSQPLRLTRRTLLRALAALLACGGALGMAGPRPARATDPAVQKWICTNGDCKPYIYDPQVGDHKQGIPPGVAFEDLPDDWYCPDCGATKVEFIRYYG